MVKQIVYGVERDIDIPLDIAPTQDEQGAYDKLLEGSQHGWFESSVSVSIEGDGGSCSNTSKKMMLHYRKWLPKEEPMAVVIYMHGILGHTQNAWEIEYDDDGDGENNKITKKNKRRRLNFALLSDSYLAKGYAVYAFDMLGHGFSEGTRWFIPDSYDVNKRDYINFCKLVEKEQPNIPMFLQGESYGGCLTLHVAKCFQDHPNEAPKNFNSILLLCPAIIGDMPPYPVYALLRYVLAPMFPQSTPFFMPNTLPPERIWRDEAVLRAHVEGRETKSMLGGGGRKFCLGTALNLVLALEECRENAIPSLKVPFCVAHGKNDYGVPIAGSELLWEQCSTPESDREFLRVDDAYHDLLGDPCAEDVMQFCTEWIEKRLLLLGTSATTTSS